MKKKSGQKDLQKKEKFKMKNRVFTKSIIFPSLQLVLLGIYLLINT